MERLEKDTIDGSIKQVASLLQVGFIELVYSYLLMGRDIVV